MNSGNHNYKIESFDLICSPINIGSNIWIGCFSIILPGSNVPSNTIITFLCMQYTRKFQPESY